MIDKINFVDVKKTEYSDVLQVAELFYADRINTTIFNAMAYVVNFSIDEKKKDGEAFPMMIHTGIYEAVNVEYNLFVKALSMNYTKETQNAFLSSFSIKEGVREESNMKAPLFLCGAILRKYLKLLTEIKSYSVKNEEGRGFEVLNFYIPIIYEKNGVAKQMSAVTIKLDRLIDLISEVPNSGSLYKTMEYCYGGIVEYKQVAFGIKQCNQFWFKNNKHKQILYKAF